MTREERYWERQFAALVRFRRKHGHCLVAQSWQGDPNLAKWVAAQRAAWRRDKLRPDRFVRLQRVGLFGWDYLDALWEWRFAELEAYRRRHGNCQVPSRSKKSPSLGNWVAFQRTLKRSGRISGERSRRLERIGFEWVSRGRSVQFRDSSYWDRKWERMLAKLTKFKRRFGHCWVPTTWPGAPKLGQWVSRQRKLKHQGLLDENRRRKLDALGFSWRTPDSANPRWERCFLRLLEFRRRVGHCQVPWESSLGKWGVKTRRLYRAGRLSADKVRRLNAIGFVWDPIAHHQIKHDAVWSKWLGRLVRFHKKHGHWCVPTDQRRFHRLRVWMDNQRINYQRGWQTAERIRQMEAAGFPWLSDRQQLAAKAHAGANERVR